MTSPTRLSTLSNASSNTLRLAVAISALGGESGDAGEGTATFVEIVGTVAVSPALMASEDMEAVEEGAAGRASACAVAMKRRTAAEREEMCMLSLLYCARGYVMAEYVEL